MCTYHVCIWLFWEKVRTHLSKTKKVLGGSSLQWALALWPCQIIQYPSVWFFSNLTFRLWDKCSLHCCGDKVRLLSEGLGTAPGTLVSVHVSWFIDTPLILKTAFIYLPVVQALIVLMGWTDRSQSDFSNIFNGLKVLLALELKYQLM